MSRGKEGHYYIFLNNKPCYIPPALLNNRLAIVIITPISNTTVGPRPNMLFFIGTVCLHFDLLTFYVMTSGEIMTALRQITVEISNLCHLFNNIYE